MGAEHPDWLAVGSEVEVERRHGRSVAARLRVSVSRHTKTSVFVTYGKGAASSEERYVPKGGGLLGPRYTLVPKYSDYTTTLVRPADKENPA